MATKPEVETPVNIYTEQVPCPEPAKTTEDIVRELVSQGKPIEKIRIPGKVKSHILYIADDFDAPLDDFKDYR